jgi:hypothetical protein
LPYEETIAYILHNFGSINHLTIIVADYASPTEIRHLVDPEELIAAFAYLGNSYRKWPLKSWNKGRDVDFSWRYEQREPHCRCPGRIKKYCEMAAIDLDLLERFRKECLLKKGSSGKEWQIPKIEYKVAMPLEIEWKDWYDGIKKEQENKMASQCA